MRYDNFSIFQNGGRRHLGFLVGATPSEGFSISQLKHFSKHRLYIYFVSLCILNIRATVAHLTSCVICGQSVNQ